MKGINFEEWKALVKKNRQALNTKSNIYRSEPESLTWGAEKAVKIPEYGQIHTITYNVTGMEVPSDWPTEIKSGKRLSLNIVLPPYGSNSTIAANVDYTYTNDVLKINNVLSDITITINIGEVLYQNAKIGDYLYSDWTFGPSEKPGYLGRCVGLAEDFSDGKSRWGMMNDSTTYFWCQSSAKQDTSLVNYVDSDSAKTDIDGKQNTQVLLNIAGGGYDAAIIAQQSFDGNGYLPAAGELFVCGNNINAIFNPNMPLWSSTECDFDFVYDYYLGRIAKNRKIYSDKVISFINLSGKPINTNGHEYVDLGLPSGTLWATMNVGANSETDAGLYFQWGDAQGYTADQVGNGEGQKAFSWADYKWTEDGGSTMSKYNATDGKTILDLEDDAVRENWSGDWKMPTEEQFQELLNTDNCTNVWTTVDGVNGRLFTSVSNGNTLFIPAAGVVNNGSINIVGSDGFVWSNSLDSNIVILGRFLAFSSGGINMSSNVRFTGYPARGVI